MLVNNHSQVCKSQLFDTEAHFIHFVSLYQLPTAWRIKHLWITSMALNDCIYMDLKIPVMIRFFKYPIFVFVHVNIISWFQKQDKPVSRFWEIRFATWRTPKIKRDTLACLTPVSDTPQPPQPRWRITKTNMVQQREHYTSRAMTKQVFFSVMKELKVIGSSDGRKHWSANLFKSVVSRLQDVSHCELWSSSGQYSSIY